MRADLVRAVRCASDEDTILDVHDVHLREALVENTVARSTELPEELLRGLSNEKREDMFGTDLIQVGVIGELRSLLVNAEDFETAWSREYRWRPHGRAD